LRRTLRTTAQPVCQLYWLMALLYGGGVKLRVGLWMIWHALFKVIACAAAAAAAAAQAQVLHQHVTHSRQQAGAVQRSSICWLLTVSDCCVGIAVAVTGRSITVFRKLLQAVVSPSVTSSASAASIVLLGSGSAAVVAAPARSLCACHSGFYCPHGHTVVPTQLTRVT
jgi:hypothetical protein